MFVLWQQLGNINMKQMVSQCSVAKGVGYDFISRSWEKMNQGLFCMTAEDETKKKLRHSSPFYNLSLK